MLPPYGDIQELCSSYTAARLIICLAKCIADVIARASIGRHVS